jgi:DNA-binding transcriptional ArsR family regulator
LDRYSTLVEESESSFNESRAEVFEALGHPTRLKILQALSEKPLGFSELKRATGVDSNGLLAFHLRKLGDLVVVNTEGSYALADEGKEAIRIVQASVNAHGTPPGSRWSFHIPRSKAIVAGLLVALVLFGSFAVYQQQISSLSRSLSSEQAGSILINGERYWHTRIPLQSLNLPATIGFDNVTFDLKALSFGGSYFLLIIGTSHNTSTAVPSAGQPIEFRVAPIPNVQVRFADGQTEGQYALNSTGSAYVSLQPAANPWFTHHSGPRAGVYVDSVTGSIELYVSMGS